MVRLSLDLTNNKCPIFLPDFENLSLEAQEQLDLHPDCTLKALSSLCSVD